MIVRNLTKKTTISSDASLADSPFARMRGLLGQSVLSKGQGLVITQCNSIHMFFMKFPIDAVFIDRKGIVVGLVKNIQPFCLSPIFWSADKVVELPVGTIDATKTCIGDTYQIPELSCLVKQKID